MKLHNIFIKGPGNEVAMLYTMHLFFIFIVASSNYFFKYC